MAFYAKTFVFDGIPSEYYGLILSSSDGGEGTSNGSSNIEIIQQEVYKRPVPYFYGVKQTPVLQFEIQIRTVKGEITAEEASVIQNWLFGQQTYKKLRVVQIDMEDYYFNCFLTNPQIVRVGNIIRGFNATVSCNSPYAWGQEISLNLTETLFNYYVENRSQDSYYTFPQMVVQLSTLSTSFFIRNKSDKKSEIDDGRLFGMNDFIGGDKITINNDLQIIDTVLTPSPLNKFAPSSEYFFRLVPGLNILYITGGIEYISLSYTPMKRMA